MNIYYEKIVASHNVKLITFPYVKLWYYNNMRKWHSWDKIIRLCNIIQIAQQYIYAEKGDKMQLFT